MTDPPAFTFFSSLRRGLAAGIAQADAGGVPGHVSVTATATTSAGAAAPIALRLMGPGDITGVDNRVILRTFPKPNETSHPPNLYVTLELDRPELPWLFTPAKAGADDRLHPWLGLVVVEAIGGNAVTSDASKPLPNLHVDDGAQLPNPDESWAWAHVAVSGSLADPDDVKGLLTTNPERVIARLMCPRRLDGASSYIAALVPFFENGRKAGAGETFDDTGNLAHAWQAGSPADLPVYYHWEFSTGPVGDFRSLALLLHHVPPATNVGSRPMDITNPGGGLLRSTPTPRRRPSGSGERCASPAARRPTTGTRRSARPSRRCSAPRSTGRTSPEPDSGRRSTAAGSRRRPRCPATRRTGSTSSTSTRASAWLRGSVRSSSRTSTRR